MKYDSVHNFNKNSVPHFNEISSIDCKFDNNFYKDFKKLNAVKNQTEEKKQKKITILKNASMLYDELISVYKNKHNKTFKSKCKSWRLKYDYKNLKI